MRAGRRHSLGVSLIEAMVAMSVMGVGTLAVLGVQGTLRANSDLSKQRSEAVRVAQEQMEVRRGFGNLAQYDAIAAGTVDVPGANATYRVTREIVDPAANAVHAPRYKSLRINVAWEDRTGQTQQVRMGSVIHAMPPALAGSLAVPANLAPVLTPQGRHAGIPADAVVMSGTFAGTSQFTPLTGSTERWYFNNVTGAITQICANVELACTATNARLLAGFVRFAALAAPAGEDPGETPTGPDATLAPLLNTIGVRVTFLVPASPAPAPSPASVTCPARPALPDARAYHCAVPVNGSGAWSGRASVTGLDGLLAATATSTEADRYRVCRYTPFRDAHPVVPSGMRNDQHPLDYVDVGGPLLNQNFLVRRAADGCPADGPSPLLNSNTWHHQPAT